MNRRGFFMPNTVRNRKAKNRDGAPVSKTGNNRQSQPVFARRSSTGTEPYTGAWTYTQAAHLLRRCMVGATDADIRKALSDGMSATVTNLLKPHTVAMDIIQSWAGQDPQISPQRDTPTSNPTQAQQDAFTAINFNHRDQVTRWSLKTVIDAPVSIQERMVMFWMNHFVIELDVVNFAEFTLTWNQLIRTDCLGNLKKFVSDITFNAGMLIYLNGNQNYKTGSRDNINENYGRELMELFTMGITDWNGNNNYTQTDVHEAGRSLSGWVNEQSTKTPVMNEKYIGLGTIFTASRWDSGSKTFLGQTGNWKAQDVVDILFAQRADQIAKFICGKIYSAFVYSIQDQTVITQMAETLRSNNWEIAPVMDQLLRSAHFYDETNIGAMEKSPMDYMLGAIRGLNLGTVPDFQPNQTRQSQDLAQRISNLGQTPLDPPNVKGWEGGRNWISTSTAPTRQKFMLDVMDSKLKLRINNQQTTVYTFNAVEFAKSLPDYDDIHKLSTNMALYLLNTAPSAAEAQMLYDTLLDGGKDYEWNIDDAAQRAEDRIRKFIKAAVQLAKYQLY